MTKREWWFAIGCVGAIASSYWGAHRATVNALQAPSAQIRVAEVRQEQRQVDSIAAVRARIQRIIEIRAQQRERARLDGLCYFDFKHAVGNDQIKKVLDGYGPAMESEHGRCELVGFDSVRWRSWQ